MTNEEMKQKENIIYELNKIFKNNKKEENITFNVNLPIKKQKRILNDENVLLNNNNTISFERLKYIKFFTSIFNNNESLKNPNNIKKKNKTQIFSDKIIQTPSYFYKTKNIILNKSHFVPILNKKIIIKIKNSVFPKSIAIKKDENQKVINNIKLIRFTKSFGKDKYIKIKNQILSRNKLSPIIKLNKKKVTKIRNIKHHLTNDYIPAHISEKKYFPISEKRQHKNLLNIENIYFQGQKHYNHYLSKRIIPFEGKKLKIKLHPLKKSFSVKDIKYPLNDNKYKTIKIINENNEHLLEKIYKHQTLSNFNNKYELKFKTNNINKKERIQFLFSLLKKFQHSEQDKKNVFHQYSRIKKPKKFNI